MSVLYKIASGGASQPDGEFTIEPGAFGDDYPGIFEVLCRTRLEGKDRQVGRLIMFSEPGHASLCLCDKECGVVAFHAADGFLEALEGLEQRLQEGKLDWRRDRRARYAGK